jgi:TonB family protein
MSLFFATLAILASASSPSEAPRWGINEGQEYCSLIRQGEGGEYGTLLVRQRPGSDLSLWLTDRKPVSKFMATSEDVTIALEPDQATFTAPAMLRQLADGRALMIYPKEKLLDELGRAERIVLKRNGKLLFQARLGMTDRAVAALRKCEKKMLAAWGIDPDRFFALKSLPTPKQSLGSLVSNRDYPVAAAAAGRGGTVTVRLDVDEQGKTEGCRIVFVEGHDALGTRTCEILTERASFSPARDAADAPTKAPLIVTIQWLLMA